MTSIRKFTFDLRFDEDDNGFAEPNPSPGDVFYASGPQTAEEPEIEEEDEPELEEQLEPDGPELIYTEEDMEIAREESYVAGHMRALEESQTATQHATAQALQSVKEGLDGITPLLDQRVDELGDLAAHVAAEICSKLLPHTASHYAIDEISGLVRAMMPSLLGQPRLVIRVNPELVGPIRSAVEDVAELSGFEGKIVVIAGEGMGVTDARIEWPDGGAERNTDRLWKEVDALIKRNIPHFSREEALELPDDPASSDETPWPDIADGPHWTPPSPRDDFEHGEQTSAAVASQPQPAQQPRTAPSDNGDDEDRVLPPPTADDEKETADLIKTLQQANREKHAREAAARAAEISPDDADGPGLSAEQEAELDALDQSLADAQKAAMDAEK